MKYHLDRRVVFNTQSRHPNLYSWCLQELDEAGEPTGRDLIPWDGTQYFDVTELSLVVSEGVKPNFSSDADDAVRAQASTRISATLVPDRERQGILLNPETRFSMVGTDRWDVAFRLVVRPPSEDFPDTACRVWGNPSYSFELDFRECTQDAEVVFDLTVSQATFDRYAEIIRASAGLSGQLQVSGVSGFYSDWSPSISTDSVKVLTEDQRNHVVEGEEDAGFPPPRLGKIRDARFDLVQRVSLRAAAPSRSETETAGEVVASENPAAFHSKENQDAGHLSRLVGSLLLPLWLVAFLLLLTLFK